MFIHRTADPGSPGDRPSRFKITQRSRAVLVLAAAVAALAPLAVPALAQATTTATIAVGAFPWEVAADPTTGLVYVTNENSNTVSVISEATDTVTHTIPVGSEPQGIAVDSTTDTIYVTNFAADSLSVINGATSTVTHTVTGLGTDPDAVAVDAATNTLYVSGYLSSNIFVINGMSNTVTATIAVPGANIHDLAVDPATDTLYASAYNLNSVAVINTSTNTVTGYLTGLQGPDGLAADATTGHLYAAMNFQSADRIADYKANTIWNVIHPKHDPANGHTVAVDAPTDTVFASLSANPITGAGTVAVINGNTDKITQTVTVGDDPNGIDVDPTTGTVFVANSDSNTVTAFAG
jgi:YVTN family beta-propeller protein